MFVNKLKSRSQGLPGASLLRDKGDPEQVRNPETREIQRILCWCTPLGTHQSLGAINFVTHLYILVRLYDGGNGACDEDKRPTEGEIWKKWTMPWNRNTQLRGNATDPSGKRWKRVQG